MRDCILIRGLALEVHIGVPEEERQTAQRLELDVRMEVARPFEGLDDDLQGTIDYAAVAGWLRDQASRSRCRLVETLIANLADGLLVRFRPASVELELRKFILPDCQHVAVRICRERKLDKQATV